MKKSSPKEKDAPVKKSISASLAIISALLIISLVLNVYQSQKINQANKALILAENNYAWLETQALDLENKVTDYFASQGKLCYSDTVSCLDDLILGTNEAIRCDPEQSADCCNSWEGMEWLEGQGCVVKE